jgi:23S rRNA pseudouridine2605 synthase/16S rRNA pseudouridine516 synthase
VRLQKILSRAGVTSRRKAEDLILAGRVLVNGKIVCELGAKADPLQDVIEVDGVCVRPVREPIAVLLYKPTGYITSLHDPQGRPTVAQLVSVIPSRLYPVGRLDYDTEGLLIMTNDGDLAQMLQHPSHAIEKVYLAKVKGIPEEKDLNRLRNGIVIERRKTLAAKIRVLESRHHTWLQVAIREGRQNQIRKMFERVGHPVLKLKRVAIGALRDPHLKPGQFRILKKSEIRQLIKVAGK